MANFKAANVIPREYTWKQKKRLIKEAKQYWWDKPYLYREGNDGFIRRC
ncbi:putative pol-like polyprotein/retrotransposon, partial [Trifolium medium]|nr:putative pol-like polyprotein/retrotransposon [Trifolium medium]